MERFSLGQTIGRAIQPNVANHAFDKDNLNRHVHDAPSARAKRRDLKQRPWPARARGNLTFNIDDPELPRIRSSRPRDQILPAHLTVVVEKDNRTATAGKILPASIVEDGQQWKRLAV
jgi:hypothetical protein